MAGRPTKLTPTLIKKAKSYDWAGDGEAIPTIEGLSLHMSVARSSVYLWMDDESALGREFSDIVNEIFAKQGRTLITKGLKGDFNASITKLMLSKHGYVEVKDIQSGGEKISNIVQLPAQLDENFDATNDMAT